MTHVQKGAKYTLKNLLGKTREENDLRMKVLRYVMAVGFVLSPWLGGEAYAAGIERIDNITLPNGLDKTYLQNGSNVAHIYAEQASGDVGLNRFKTFEVGANQIANLYFKTSATDTNHLNTLVNTVQEQISISGTVNAIRNNEIGGKLYFLSPNGMVVCAGGVINAGQLTVIATDKTFQNAEEAASVSWASGNWALKQAASIDIQGQINAKTGIDLRALSIAVSKAPNSGINPYLKTGMLFNTIVNTDGLVKEVTLQNRDNTLVDNGIQLQAYQDLGGDDKFFGSITLSGCDVDALGEINIKSGESLNVTNNTNINTNNAINIDLEHTNTNSQYVGNFVFESGRIEAGGMPYITIGDSINISNGATFVSTLVTTDTINFKAHQGSIYNYGNIQMQSTLNMQAGIGASGGTPCLINSGTIQSQGGGLSLTAKNNITNNGTIEANAQIKFAVGGTLTNQGTIESTSSNVQAHIGRDFKNIAKPDPSDSSKLIGGIIKAGGNVQVDYNLDNEGIGVASSEERIDGIYNSGLIQANGDEDPTSTGGVVDKNSGSGNIWLTSSYNITNYGTMEANRQITLNARDFLHNYGLIQGVTYLDIKSIMGYVYNHNDGVIRATGGNIDLSSGQANLQIKNDTDGQKKELYRKFTPITIEGIVQATSDDDRSNQTREGNIKITAYLGDIYVNGGTIETNAKTSETGEVKAVAGDVILDAAQNITIGFQTESALADDPTTDGANYNNDTEREYYKPLKDTSGNLVSGNAANISGTNIILTSGSGKTISMSEVNNTLTASNAITINTDNMNIVGGTFNANTLAASKNLNIVGGTINTNNITAGIIDGVNNGGQLTITGGAINVANVTANGALTLTGGTVGRTDSSLSIIGTGDVSIGSDAIVRTSSDVSIASDEGTVTNNSELNISGSVSLSGKTDVTNSANITAGKDVSMTATTGKVNNSKVVKASGGNINLTGGTSINLQEGYGLEASDTINLTTDDMQITGGTIKANTLASSKALTLTGGTINAANISAGTNLIHNGATITADNDVTISAGNNINLRSGSLTANGAAFVVTNGTAGANSIVESASGYNLGVGSLSLSANQGNIALKGTDNVLQSVTLADVGGNVEIVNGNDTNKNVLTISTAKGATVGGTISIDNKGAGITVAGVNARDAVNLTAGESITVDGDVVAATASFGTGVDFIHNGGAIAAGEVVVTAGRDILLNSGSMEASTSASLTAKAGSIAEQAGYAIDAPRVTLSATGGINLDSTANKLVNVNATQVGGALTIGSGNTKSDAALQIATADKVQGDLTVINYASDGDAKANEIVFGNNIKATGNIVLNNQETDINIGQGLTITSASESVTISSAGNVAVAGTVDAAKNASLVAGKGVSVSGSLDAAGATMQAGENIALSGTITANDITLTAAEAISQTAGSIVAINTVATAGGDLSLARETNKLQNVTVKADEGSVTIVSGNDAEGALKVKTDGIIGGDLTITNVANGGVNNIVIDNDLLANGNIIIQNDEAGINLGTNVGITSNIGGISITALKDLISAGIINAVNDVILKAINNNLNMSGGSITATGGSIALHGKGGINNGASITAKGNVGLYSTGGSITNSAHIIAGHNFASATRRAALFSLRALAQETEETGSVTMSGKYGVANTASASVSAEQSVSMTSTAGSVNNSSEVTSNSGAVVISGQTGVTNTGAVTATGGSVEISGSSVSNTGAVNATGGSVTMSGSGGVTNDADINAKDSVTMTSEQGTVDNSNTVSAGTGTVTMSGKTGVVNDNAGATISAGSGVSMTSSAEGVTNSSAVKSTSGTVEMDGQKTVTNTGAVTATGGFVTMSGSGGVTNDADISAKDSVTMTSSAGAVDNSNAITVSNGSVTMTGQTSVNNEGELKANGGSVTMSGNGGVTNSANITAGSDVSMTTDKGKISNSGTIEASNKIGMTSTSGDISSTNKVESLNGSISATTTYGEVNISEIIAGGNATASSQSGSVSIGTVAGNDVVLTGGSNVTIGSVSGNNVAISGGSNSDVDVDNITVDNSLKLQGDNIAVDSVGRGSDAGTDALNVDVNGAGGAGSAVQGSLNLKITGDVVFDNLNVTDANVTASGNIDVNKLRVEGEGETTLVSNKTEGDENGTKVTVVGKDATPPAGSNVIVDPGNDSGNWLNIKMDEEGSKTTVVDDAGRDVNNKDYPAQMSAKLVDYDPYDTYLEHYADMADIFTRSYLIDAPERSTSDILFPAQGGRVVLKQDANGLHLEIVEEQSEQEA